MEIFNPRKRTLKETIKVLDKMNIDYEIFTQGVKEMFKNYNKEEYNNLKGNCIFFRDGTILKLGDIKGE